MLVVHKHLGADSLQRWLIEQAFPTERLASSSGYRVLRQPTCERSVTESGIGVRTSRSAGGIDLDAQS